jgi:hypothetical protein
MGEKLQTFRWKGPGVLHIQRLDGERRVIPAYEAGQIEKACIVKDSDNLEALGAARIAEFLRPGPNGEPPMAEAVNWVEGLTNALREDKGPALDDAKQADEIAQKAAKDSASVEKQAKAEKAAGNPKATGEKAGPSSMASAQAAAGPRGDAK